jgi:hypothetical protein
MSAASVSENVVARKILADMKSGGLLKGFVSSTSANGSQGIAWVVVQLPLLGDRRVCVTNEAGVRPGQTVALRCVPDSSRPQRFVFQLAGKACITLPQRLGLFWNGRADCGEHSYLN